MFHQITSFDQKTQLTLNILIISKILKCILLNYDKLFLIRNIQYSSIILGGSFVTGLTEKTVHWRPLVFGLLRYRCVNLCRTRYLQSVVVIVEKNCRNCSLF